jgi:hypothetical protein
MSRRSPRKNQRKVKYNKGGVILSVQGPIPFSLFPLKKKK